MFQWVRVSAAKAEDLSSIPMTHTVEEETKFENCSLIYAHALCGVHILPLHKINK